MVCGLNPVGSLGPARKTLGPQWSRGNPWGCTGALWSPMGPARAPGPRISEPLGFGLLGPRPLGFELLGFEPMEPGPHPRPPSPPPSTNSQFPHPSPTSPNPCPVSTHPHSAPIQGHGGMMVCLAGGVLPPRDIPKSRLPTSSLPGSGA